MTPTQYPDESDAQYRSFLGWLLSRPRRLPTDEDLARQFDWALRAAQFDAAYSGPASFDAVPNQHESTKKNLERLVALEVQKYLQRSEGAVGVPVLTPAELIRLVSVLSGKKELDPAAQEIQDERKEVEPDLSGLSHEELALLEKMYEK